MARGLPILDYYMVPYINSRNLARNVLIFFFFKVFLGFNTPITQPAYCMSA